MNLDPDSTMWNAISHRWGAAGGARYARRTVNANGMAPWRMFPAVVLTMLATAACAQDARVLAAGCAACHGTGGAATLGGRTLAGARREDIAATLRAFKTDARAGTVMPEIAKGYSDPEIDALAAWFAARPQAR
jgi:sulfide dehydrogenase cytochrome subunit